MPALPDENRICDYLLGFLGAWQRRRMNRHIEADPELALAVEDWHERLAPLATLAKPVTPPDEIWQEVQRRIAAPTARQNWAWALPAGAAAIATIGLLLWQDPSPVYRADLRGSGDETARPVAIVEADVHNDLMVRNEGLPALPAGKSFELWIIPAGGAPRSLGVMPPGGIVKMHTDLPRETVSFAISVEPLGGSPTGTATGPVIASGVLRHS